VQDEGILLGERLQKRRDVPILLTSVVPTEDGTVLHLLVRRDDRRLIERTLESNPAATDITTVSSGAEYYLVSAKVLDSFGEFFKLIADFDATVLQGSRTADNWFFRIQFPNTETLREGLSQYDSLDVDVRVTQIHYGIAADERQFGLTPTQQEVLICAHEAGYFSVPREISLAALSNRLDLSDTAVSQHIRRGVKTLIDATLQQDWTNLGPSE
jgi:predicted DNA binding protein